MDTLKLKMRNKVIAQLKRRGHNEERLMSWVNEHFDYAYKYYNTASKMAEVIQTID